MVTKQKVQQTFYKHCKSELNKKKSNLDKINYRLGQNKEIPWINLICR